jgi:hypothetical protein
VSETNIRVKDPHVFPFIVKGYKEGQPLQLESRRTRVEADQSVDGLRAAGYETSVFELKEIQRDADPRQ